MNIVLCSVGRRPYLVKWFKEALKDNNVEGKIIAADMDPFAPSRAFADEFVLAPSVSSPDYLTWLSELLISRDVSLAISVNDFELSTWAQLPRNETFRALIRLDSNIQELAEDKLEMAARLKSSNVPTPNTWSGVQAHGLSKTSKTFVTKGRFGSASRGLRFTNAKNLNFALAEAIEEVTDPFGIPARQQNKFEPENLVVIQEQIVGTEYGLDVVCDLNGNFAAVLARKKIAMRSGETDKAQSVDSSQFEEIAKKVALAVPHQGLIDVDVLVDGKGDISVIDVNPRFGGGYPFSHLAGARIPSCYVAWVLKLPIEDRWLRYENGVTSGKFVDAVRI